MLDQKLAQAMQRVLSLGQDRYTLNLTLQRLLDAGIGTKLGKSIYFSDKDRNAMRNWLEAKGFSQHPVTMSGLTRAQTLSFSPNEKAGGEAVKRNRVSIKSLAGQFLSLGGRGLLLPSESHLDVDWTKIVDSIGHQAIMVVENYENFNRIHETQFNFPDHLCSPLVVYRGDPYESRTDSVQAFLLATHLPVMAFVDMDPAGLAIASGFPRLSGVVAPDVAILEQQLSSPRTGRRDLFQAQYSSAHPILDSLPQNNPCLALWNRVLNHRSGVVQERWITGVVCSLID